MKIGIGALNGMEIARGVEMLLSLQLSEIMGLFSQVAEAAGDARLGCSWALLSRWLWLIRVPISIA